MKRFTAIFVALLLCLALTAACAPAATPTPTAAPGTPAPTQPQGTPTLNPKYKEIRIGTASMTGNSYTQGSVIATMINDKVAGMTSTAQATGGSGDNCGLLAEGEIELAFIQSATAKEAYTGTGSFTKPVTSLRAAGVILVNQFHIIVNNKSNITKVADLKGKKIGVSTMGGGVEANATILLGLFGVKSEEYNHVYSTMNEALEMVKTGEVDCVVYATSYGNANVYDTLSAGTCTLLALSQEDVTRISAASTEFGKGVIPAGTYPDVKSEILTISGSQILMTDEQVDADTVYILTKAFYENAAYMGTMNKVLGGVSTDFYDVGVCVPYHEGTIRYFKEIGIMS